MAVISNLIVNLIAKTGAFERDIKRAKGTLADFDKSLSFRQIKGAMAAGAIAVSVRTLADSITEVHKAAREGKNWLDALMGAMPLGIASLHKSFKGLADELDGTNTALEKMNKGLRLTNELSQVRKSIAESQQRLRLEAMGYPTEAIRAMENYRRQLESISKVEEEMKKAGPDFRFGAGMFLDVDILRAKQGALALYWKELEKIRRIQEETARKKEYEKWLNEVQTYYSSLEAFAKGVQEKIKTPFERFEEYITKLSEALNAGYLSWEHYGEAVRLARHELEGGKFGRVGAGIAEAINLGQVSVRGLALNTEQSLQRELLEETKKQTKLQQRIVEQRGDIV